MPQGSGRVSLLVENARSHSKYVFFQLSEAAVTRNLFAATLDRIERLALPLPLVAGHGA